MRILVSLAHFGKGDLKVFQKIMPVSNKLFIAVKVRHVNPSADFYLGPVLTLTFFNLKKVAKGPVFVIPSQRKQAAEAGAEIVDGTPARLCQKGAPACVVRHLNMGQNNTVHHA